MSESQASCPSLNLLQITGNQLQDWSEVRKFGLLYPSLSTLVLANNGLSSVGDTKETLEHLFPNLRSINLNNSGWFLCACSVFREWFKERMRAGNKSFSFSNTGLSKWEDIERLSFFPKLEDVKAQGIPLLQTYSTQERRSLLLAQLVKHSF